MKYTPQADAPAIAWIRVPATSAAQLAHVKQRLGLDLVRAVAGNVRQDGAFSLFAVTFSSLAAGRPIASRVVFALGRDTLVSLEPHAPIAPLQAAQQRLERAAHDSQPSNAFTCFAAVLQAMNDATDELLDGLGDKLGAVLVQTNAVLGSLEARERDFGISDVVAAQMDLGEVEALLSGCIESQLQLAQAARHALARLPPPLHALRPVFLTLVGDIEAVEEHVSFVHDRVRLLQATNNMALNVKQNQIIKVFSVVTAVFLPAMLISTFYSMNFVHMPALALPFGEPLVIGLTALFSLLPLLYVKQRGWLR